MARLAPCVKWIEATHLVKGDVRPAIIYFGNDWFAENRTSSHQIALRLAREFRVFYIECPGLRAPKSSGRDLKKIWKKLLRFLQGSRAVDGGLKVRTLLQIPLHRFAVVRSFNRAFILITLKWLIWREGIRRPITWFMVPHLSSIVGRLQERLSVYYCIDDYASLPDVNPSAVRAMDEELTQKADIVFVASETLREAKKRLNLETYVSPHGVDFEHFSRAREIGLQTPPEMLNLSRPVIGFFGLIERWIDLDLVDYLASARPDWSFVLIGRVAVPATELPKSPNVHLIGKRSYDQLPAYGGQFDAAIIPYRLNNQVLHANPIKLREYLAMGVPVVSVRTPEIEKYSDVVGIANSFEEFLAKLDVAVTCPPTSDEIQERMDRVACEGWDSRVARVLEVIDRRTQISLPMHTS